MAEHSFDPLDISSLEFWSRTSSERDKVFTELRRDRPVSFHRPITFGIGALLGGVDPGFWALTTHDLVRRASRDAETFCSSKGTSIEDIPPEFNDALASFLAMDGQQHNTLRRLVSSAFTPRNVARIEEQIAGHATAIVDRLIDIGDCDFVAEVSMRLPMWTISEMIGVPDADRDRLANAANTLVASSDPEFLEGGATVFTLVIESVTDLTQIALELAQARRAAPRDDLMSALVQADIDGERLTDKQIAAFMVLLAVAGNDTTRQTTSHAMKALCDNPEQRALLSSNLDAAMPAAVEEMIRWATPVVHFRRTATRDIELHGSKIAEGDKVVLFYESANRDEAVFAEPWKFDLQRNPNDHLGFGGGGAHYCLGAQLARSQLRSLFSELLRRAPDLTVGEPDYLAGSFIHGIKRMPCSIGRAHD
jgi:cytochrome P450